ncbi:MAG: Gfo/Idh/MocA family oxidoreductase [Chloroflexi bacterium]|nr:Gfo/Idh/MocA family oxidoreductase [Chloroflexota bacterium]
MTTKNGWGLIGTGRIAEERILPGITGFDGNDLVAVVSREQRRANDFAGRFGAQRAYTSYEEMLANPDVTVVAIHTPNSLHAEQAIMAAQAGKHVFCDKPMAINTADAERIVEACARTGVRLGVNFHNRFMACFIEVKRIVDSGEIGNVLLVELEASAGARPGGSLATWRADPQMAGLGTSMTVGVHVYDILRFILSSEIVTVSTVFDTPRGVMEQTAMSIFGFDNGVIAQVKVNEKTPNPYNGFVVYGTKGRITGKGLTRSRFGGELEVLVNGETRSSEYPAKDAHAASVAAFSAALIEGREPSPSGIDGLRSVQLTDAMARSAWEGVHVRLSH